MDLYTRKTDQELLSQLSAGDEQAYAAIYERYKSLLFNFALRRLGDGQESEDLLHEVFLSLWKNRTTLDPAQNLAPYLYSAVRYRIIKLYARQKVAARYLDAFNAYEKQAFTEEEADHLLRHKELSALIESEIEALPKKMREVFQLSRDSGKNRKEIAQELGLSEETVKSHMHHALKILKARLGTMMVLIFF